MARLSKQFRSFQYGARRAIANAAGVLCLSAGLVNAEPITLVAFGDSLTQGYGLPSEDGFVPNLETYLRDQGLEVQVINGGVSGDTTAGAKSRVAWTLTPDVDAMIVTFGGNDFLRGLPPAEAEANLRFVVETAQAAGVEVMLVGMEVSNNYGADYRAEFEGLYPALAAEFDIPLYPTFFQGILADDIESARNTYMQADGIHPNAQGVDAIVADMGPVVVTWLSGLADSQG